VEDALSTAIRQPTTVVASGRTDAGVHAWGQVAHFDSSDTLDVKRLTASLNGLLAPSVAVVSVDLCADDFHARYDARKREYRYHVSTEVRALDRHMRIRIPAKTEFGAMNAAATYLLGPQNFSAFCRTQSETENRVCDVSFAEWIQDKRRSDWYFRIEADRFLHGMVRAIVGTLLEIGVGRRSPEDLLRIIASQDRREAGAAAPARGLVLVRVQY
jgi:tRNA pseudouridine38-40 synthase